MGADYYAYSYLGVEVSDLDFIETYKTTEHVEARCSHPEANGNRFCPKCGAEGVRDIEVENKRWKVGVREAMGAAGEVPGDFSLWDYLNYEKRLLGFQVHDLSTASIDDNQRLIYGSLVSRVDPQGRGSKNPEEKSWEALSATAEKLKKALASLGIDRPLRHFTLNYCSV